MANIKVLIFPYQELMSLAEELGIDRIIEVFRSVFKTIPVGLEYVGFRDVHGLIIYESDFLTDLDAIYMRPALSVVEDNPKAQAKVADWFKSIGCRSYPRINR